MTRRRSAGVALRGSTRAAQDYPVVQDHRSGVQEVDVSDQHPPVDILSTGATRALSTLIAGNRVLFKAHDRADLLQRMCEVVVAGGYLFAWYGVKESDAVGSVRPVAQAGAHQGYLEAVKVTWGPGPLGRGPSGRALRSGKAQVSNDIAPDPRFRPWLEQAWERGFRASTALPVRVDGDVVGALMVYAAEKDAFDGMALELLEALVADLGFGLERLEEQEAADRAQQLLAESERKYRLLAENSTDVIFLSDRSLVVRWVSPSVHDLLGWKSADVEGRGANDFLHPDDVDLVRGAVERSADEGGNVRLRMRWHTASGRYRWVESVGRPLPNGDRVVRLRDIEDQVRAEDELAERERQYRLLAENASDVVWLLSAAGTVLWTSSSVTRVLGYEAEALLGRHVDDLVDPAQRGRMVNLLAQQSAEASREGEFEMAMADGSRRWMSVGIHPVGPPDDANRVATLRDISDELRARQALDFALGHDQLTGLPNRRVALQRVRTLLREASGTSLAVLSLAVDGLAGVREGLSFAAADVVMTTVAARVVAATGASETVARGGEDELLILLPGVGPVDVSSAADSLRLAAQGPVPVAAQELLPTVSIGIAVADGATDAEALLRDSALALGLARSGGDRAVFADARMAADAHLKVELAAAIREGLDRGEFVPWLQPIVDMADLRVVGYEALVRWQQADRLVPPDDFLPVAEATGIIAEIDRAVLAGSVAALEQLPSQQFISVNVSSVTLGRTHYARALRELVSARGVDPVRLHLEVTETSLLSGTPEVRDQIGDLAELGARWYVDDFGTGYSTISNLRDLPVAGLKLDRSFVAGIGESDPTCLRLADALAGLARGLELDAVAEGVETGEELAELRRQGWPHGQGWLFGRPAPVAQAVANSRGMGGVGTLA